MSSLNPTKALIFRIIHIANVPWTLDHGLQCRNSQCLDPDYIDIGNPDLIGKRTGRAVPIPPGGTLSDYIPFYFTPYSPMLYNIKTGYGGMRKTPMPDIAILVSSLHKVAASGQPFVFTDRHAYLQTASYYNETQDLKRVDWPLLQARDFRRDPDDPGKFERYQAEALVHEALPVSLLLGIVCHGPTQAHKLNGELASRGLSLKVVTKPGWYF